MLWLLWLLCLSLANADFIFPPFNYGSTENGTFTNPSSEVTFPASYVQNPAYSQGELLTIAWSTSFGVVDLILVQLAPTNNRTIVWSSQSLASNTAQWAVSRGNLTFSPDQVFIFIATDTNGKDNSYFTSHSFNISGGTPAAASVNNPSTPSLGASAGVGIAAALCILLALAGGWFGYRLLLRRRQEQASDASAQKRLIISSPSEFKHVGGAWLRKSVRHISRAWKEDDAAGLGVLEAAAGGDGAGGSGSGNREKRFEVPGYSRAALPASRRESIPSALPELPGSLPVENTEKLGKQPKMGANIKCVVEDRYSRFFR